jgi:serine/threonine protein kinase
MPGYLFNYIIKDWETWSGVFSSKEEFEPLIRELLTQNGLPDAPAENCYPGTNGVFKAGNVIVKLFVPIESGMDSLPDYRSELFAQERAKRLGVSVPVLLAKGEIQDRYLFRYLIMEYIEGGMLRDIRDGLDTEEKTELGLELRGIVDRWGTKCEDFNGVDAIARALTGRYWKGAPVKLLKKRIGLLERLKDEERVFTHCDLTEDNLIIGKDGRLVVLDFADSVIAPKMFEDMPVICGAFDFDMDFLRGYYGDISEEEAADICVPAILCHEYGYPAIKSLFGDVEDEEDLYRRVLERLYRRRLTNMIKQEEQS